MNYSSYFVFILRQCNTFPGKTWKGKSGVWNTVFTGEGDDISIEYKNLVEVF